MVRRGSEVPLLGRAPELDRLRRWVDEVVRGRGRMGLVEGPAGIGKTALVAETVSHAEKAGVCVLRAAGEELEGDRPFGVVLDALAQIAQRSQRAADVMVLARTGPLPESEAATFRFRLMDEVVDAIEALCIESPLLLLVEDVHWADASSVATLHRLGRRRSDLALLVVLTARPLPRGPNLQRLADAVSDAGDAVALRPLGHDAMVAMASACLNAEVGPVLAEKLGSTGGNPLFVRELVSALDREGALERRNGRAEVGEDLLPPSLRLTILRRIGFLTPGTLEVLKVACVLGSSFAVADVAVVLDTRVTSLLPALDEARTALVVVEEGGRMAFAHDLVRESLYEDLPLDLRRALHAQAGHNLARRGAPLSQVATHLGLGAAPGDIEAVELLRGAAREAGPRAPGIAADLLLRARHVAGRTYPDRATLAAELVHWLLFSERFAEAERLARELLGEGVSGPIGRGVSRDLAVTLCFQGRLEEGIEVFESVLAEPSLPDDERALALAELAGARASTPESDRAAGEAEEARALAGALDDKATLALATGGLAMAEWSRGNLGRAAQLAAEAALLSTGAGAEVLTRGPHAVLAGILRDAERGDEAEEVARTARRLAEELGDVFTLSTMQVQDGAHHWVTGCWGDAVAELEAALVLREEIGRPRDPWCIALLAHVALHGDDLTTAASLAEELPVAGPLRLLNSLIKPVLSEARGNLDAAVRMVAEADPGLFRLPSVYGPFFLPDLVRLCLAGGETDRADLLAGILSEQAAVGGTRTAEGAALHARGLAEDDLDTLLRAVAVFRQSHAPFPRARACEDLAVALGRADRRAEALELLREATGIYEAVGAHLDLRRTEAKARALGARTGVRGSRQRSLTGWDSLTVTERRVAELVGEGLANRAIGERLFVSHRTVESHVARIFQKLQTASRSELAAAVARRGLT